MAGFDPAVDKAEVGERLRKGLDRLGRALSVAQEEQLWRLVSELLKWNVKVNLTAITAPDEVVDKHLLDSLAILPEVEGAASLLDLGAGAGFPGLPLKVALPTVELTLVDAVAKKVGFIKHAAATLGLVGVRAVHARAEGAPAQEGLPKAEVVVSRALMDLERWFPLARAYLAPGGRVVAMLGKAAAPETLEAACQASGLQVVSIRSYEVSPAAGARQVVVATAR